MLPVVIIAAAAAAAQYYQSEKARGANAKRLKELEAEFDKLVPPEYDLSVMDPPDYIKKAIPEPTMDMSAITPEQYKLIGKFKPEIAPFIAEQRPDLVKETAGMKEGRQAQLDALRQMKKVSSDRGDPELQQAMYEAKQKGQIEAQSRSASLLQDMARRGTMGSGAGLAASLQGQSDSMNRASDTSRQAAVESYRNRLQALRDSASIGGQIRGDDMMMEGKNTDIINSYNERTSRNRQAWENSRTGTVNDANRMNLNAEQSIADRNVGQNNDAAYNERDRRDALQKYLYGIRSDERSTQNNIIENQAKWRQGERDNQNQLKGKQYDDAYRKTAGSQGLAAMGMQMNTQAAQDKNQAIQGVSNAGTAGYLGYVNQQNREKEMSEANARSASEQTAMDDRAYFDKYGTWPTQEQRRKSNGGL